MLNILSLQALRKKPTGPSKVAHNTIKGLKEIGYPFVINGNPNSTDKIRILDDLGAFFAMDKFRNDAKILVGPIIEANKERVPKEIANRYTFLYPSKRFYDLGTKYHWHNHGAIRPCGIDTEKFIPSTGPKTEVIVYFKTRFQREIDLCEKVLKQKNIAYTLIDYDKGYKESYFIETLKKTKYCIWIGRQETQGIALEEILSMNIPILVRDVSKVGYRSPKTEYEKKGYVGPERDEPATAAQYFSDKCGIKIFSEEELIKNIDILEKKEKEFGPREWIVENLSCTKQAKALIALFDTIPDRDIGKDRKHKFYTPWRYNRLLRIGRHILDSKLVKQIRPYITKRHTSFYGVRKT